jgi:hypothetical protein
VPLTDAKESRSDVVVALNSQSTSEVSKLKVIEYEYGADKSRVEKERSVGMPITLRLFLFPPDLFHPSRFLSRSHFPSLSFAGHYTSSEWLCFPLVLLRLVEAGKSADVVDRFARTRSLHTNHSGASGSLVRRRT